LEELSGISEITTNGANMKKVIVIGSSNTDMVVTAAKIPLPGETILGNDFSIIAGGKGANQAVAAARAGSDVTFITKTGADDFGHQAIEGYKKDRIDTGYIFVDQQKPSGIALIIVDETSGQNSIVVAPGANGSLSTQDMESIRQEIGKADIVLIQLEIPLGTVKYALDIAHEYGVKTVLNPAPAQKLSDDILKKVDIITPNESETFVLTGIDPNNEENTKKAAAHLLQKVNECVIITLGSQGVYYLSKNGANAFLPTKKVNAVDTTAAGDVFNGYLVAGLASGNDMEPSIQLGMRAATASVCKKGAQTSIPFLNEFIEK
jgi:ribokinase